MISGKFVKINFFRALEINQRLTKIQGPLIQEKWLNFINSLPIFSENDRNGEGNARTFCCVAKDSGITEYIIAALINAWTVPFNKTLNYM